jgi:hypothetical protein
VWIHSGGGYYAIWMLDEPLLLDGRLSEATAASRALQRILSTSAEQLGFYYDRAVGDLARVLRVPGTVNGKAGLQRQCRIEEDTSLVYSFTALRSAIYSNHNVISTTRRITSPSSGIPQTPNPPTVLSGTQAAASLTTRSTDPDDHRVAGQNGALTGRTVPGGRSASPLLPHHARMLAGAGITDDQIEHRGYESITGKRQLPAEPHHIAADGAKVPGLLIALLRVDGSRWGFHYRPDEPRLRNGKVCKYEVPVGQRNGLDVPHGVGSQLGDPNVVLFVTEGVKKADAAVVHGLCCVALPGVWSWIGANPKGGKTAVADWYDVALNGRRVVLAFDSDVVRKELCGPRSMNWRGG